MSKKRNPGIDLLRGLSILYIVGFWHLMNYTDAFPDYYNIVTFRITKIVLATFVLIAGYFSGVSCKGQQELPSFYKKRFFRVYPPYCAAIVIFTILGSDITTSIKALFAVSMFVRPAPATLWFIAMLLLFYLLAPACVAMSKRGLTRYSLFYVFLFCLLLGYEYASDYLFHRSYLDIRMAVYLSPFMAGVFIADNTINIKKNILLLAAIIAFAVSCYYSSGSKRMNLLYCIPLVTTAPLLLFLWFSRLKIESLKAEKIILFLATASYFMYLFHRPLYTVMKKIYFPGTPVFQLLYLCMICLPLIIIVSHVLQKRYDALLKALKL